MRRSDLELLTTSSLWFHDMGYRYDRTVMCVTWAGQPSCNNATSWSMLAVCHDNVRCQSCRYLLSVMAMSPVIMAKSADCHGDVSCLSWQLSIMTMLTVCHRHVNCTSIYFFCGLRTKFISVHFHLIIFVPSSSCTFPSSLQSTALSSVHILSTTLTSLQQEPPYQKRSLVSISSVFKQWFQITRSLLSSARCIQLLKLNI